MSTVKDWSRPSAGRPEAPGEAVATCRKPPRRLPGGQSSSLYSMAVHGHCRHWTQARPLRLRHTAGGRCGRSRRGWGPARGVGRRLAPSVTPARISGRRRAGDRARRGDLVGRAGVVRRREAASGGAGGASGRSVWASRPGLASGFPGPGGPGSGPERCCGRGLDQDLTIGEMRCGGVLLDIQTAIPLAGTCDSRPRAGAPVAGSGRPRKYGGPDRTDDRPGVWTNHRQACPGCARPPITADGGSDPDGEFRPGAEIPAVARPTAVCGRDSASRAAGARFGPRLRSGSRRRRAPTWTAPVATPRGAVARGPAPTAVTGLAGGPRSAWWRLGSGPAGNPPVTAEPPARGCRCPGFHKGVPRRAPGPVPRARRSGRKSPSSAIELSSPGGGRPVREHPSEEAGGGRIPAPKLNRCSAGVKPASRCRARPAGAEAGSRRAPAGEGKRCRPSHHVDISRARSWSRPGRPCARRVGSGAGGPDRPRHPPRWADDRKSRIRWHSVGKSEHPGENYCDHSALGSQP